MSLFSMFTKQNNVLSPQEAYKRMKEDTDAIILDVRNDEEYRQIHIKGATLIPLDKLQKQAAKKLPDKDAQVLVYCHSGARASSAVSLLSRMGFTNVHSFGGIINWPYETV